MKKVHLGCLLVVLLLCSSCGTSFWGFQSSDLMKIQKGLSKTEVKSILGAPLYVRFDEVREEWEYRQPVAGGTTIAIVTFVDERVVALDTFQERPVGAIVTTPTNY